MTEAMTGDSRAGRFRAAIATFIAARREAKLKGNNDDAGAASKYDYATWLADAARRVGQIQAVTHVLKATHPDARGSSLHVAPSSLPAHEEIGSHHLGAGFAEDVVGNAAALDVFKFLKIEVEGRRLLDWMQAGDADLRAALSEDATQATAWMGAFSALIRTDAAPASHPLAKQVYWLTGEAAERDDHYQLLQPMFSSALAQAVHADIQDARFGEAAKEARKALRDKEPSALPLRDYRNLVARKLGGTKPQNISQLNSERGGVNYLLSSLPPKAWAERASDLSRRDSVIDELRWFGEVPQLLRALGDFLHAVRDEPSTFEIRDRVDALARGLADQLALLGASVRARSPAGWTRNDDCRLSRCEQLWLDPERAELPDRDEAVDAYGAEDDASFRDEYELGEWADEVAGAFGNWLNARMRERKQPLMGAPEMRHWARQAILDVAWPVPMQRRARVGAA